LPGFPDSFRRREAALIGPAMTPFHPASPPRGGRGARALRREAKDHPPMKISCQSCSAKYTIADEKVLGKIVKIRCKKCGATIVINGNEAQASQAAESVESGNQVYD